MVASTLIEQIISTKNKAANLKIVFVDVVAYSQRRSLTQSQVVDSFMLCLEKARSDTAKDFLEYCESNKVNFKDDVIFIPSGDGAAICFPFDGIHDVHLKFAKNILKATHEHNNKAPCQKFEEQGWCNCHANFNLAVGVSSGKCILYKDINENYNVAGSAINLAARVMNISDGSQIMFTEEAYREIIDVVSDASMDEKFARHENVSIKRDQKINVYQYVETNVDYINIYPPKDLALNNRVQKAMENMKGAGFPMFPDDKQSIDLEKMISAMEAMGALFAKSSEQSPTVIEGQVNGK